MRIRICFLSALVLAIALPAQSPQPPPHPPAEDPEPVRLPSGKLQSDEILKADYQKSLDDARELAKLADELKTDLEKSDKYVLSLPLLKKSEDIEKLAHRIHARLKH
jgi:hypothetical protein